MSLRQIFLSGVRWTSLASLASFVLGMVQVAILARLLTKSDFAWVAIAGVFVNTGLQLQIAGINAAIVQRPENKPLALSSLYWLNITIGILFSSIMIIIAILLAKIYQSPILLFVTAFYSIILLINAFSVQYKALLQKNLHFRALAISEISGTGAGFALAIWAAIQGYGPYALVAGYLARYTIEMPIIIWTGSQLFRPQWRFHWQSIRPYLVFSGFHWAERITVQLGSQLDILLIGKLLGSEALGIYDVFKRILVRPFHLLNEMLEKVTFPVLAHLQYDIKRQEKLFSQLINHLSTVNLALIIGLIIVAQPLIGWYLGAEWTAYTPVFQTLCVFFLFPYFLIPADTLLLAQGRIRQWLYAHIILLPLQMIVLSAGTYYGLTGAAVANVGAYALFTGAVYTWLIAPALHTDMMRLLNKTSIPFLIAAIAATVSFSTFFIQKNNAAQWIALLLFIGLYILLNWRYNKKFTTIIQELFKRLI